MSIEKTLAEVIVAVDHVGIAVADLEAALDLYTQTLGFTCEHRETNAEQLIDEAMLSVADSDVRIQLIAPTSPESAIARFLDKRGPGLQQIAYRVTDIDAACTTARAAGLELLYDSPRRGTLDSRINFIHPRSAGGVLVELVEPAR